VFFSFTPTLKGEKKTINQLLSIKKKPSYDFFRQDRALRKCSVNIFSDRARWRGGNIFSAGRRSNPKSLAAGEALGEAVWVMWIKKFINFTEKNHQTRLFCYFFGRCKKVKERINKN
jgi:hypothetical protein